MPYFARRVQLLLIGTFAVPAGAKLRSRSVFDGYVDAIQNLTGLTGRRRTSLPSQLCLSGLWAVGLIVVWAAFAASIECQS